MKYIPDKDCEDYNTVQFNVKDDYNYLQCFLHGLVGLKTIVNSIKENKKIFNSSILPFNTDRSLSSCYLLSDIVKINIDSESIYNLQVCINNFEYEEYLNFVKMIQDNREKIGGFYTNNSFVNGNIMNGSEIEINIKFDYNFYVNQHTNIIILFQQNPFKLPNKPKQYESPNLLETKITFDYSSFNVIDNEYLKNVLSVPNSAVYFNKYNLNSFFPTYNKTTGYFDL
jgi:hypothetical protein